MLGENLFSIREYVEIHIQMPSFFPLIDWWYYLPSSISKHTIILTIPSYDDAQQLVGLVHGANSWENETLDVSIYLLMEAKKDVELSWI